MLAAELGEQHVVMVSAGDLPVDGTVDANPDGTLHSPQAGAPWIRVAEVPFKITSLTATADAMDRITIDYAGADEVRHRVYLDEKRHPL